MTINEFKAWLEGFSAAIGDAPTQEQWETLKIKLNSVEPEVVKVTELVKVPIVQVIKERCPNPYNPIGPYPRVTPGWPYNWETIC